MVATLPAAKTEMLMLGVVALSWNVEACEKDAAPAVPFHCRRMSTYSLPTKVELIVILLSVVCPTYSKVGIDTKMVFMLVNVSARDAGTTASLAPTSVKFRSIPQDVSVPVIEIACVSVVGVKDRKVGEKIAAEQTGVTMMLRPEYTRVRAIWKV